MPKVVDVRKVNVGLRVEPSVLDRIDAIAVALSASARGITVTRSDAARIAILGGIEGLERELGLPLKGAERPARKPAK